MEGGCPLRPAVCRGVVGGGHASHYIRYREVSWQRTGQGYRSGIRPRNRVKIRTGDSRCHRERHRAVVGSAASRAQTNGENPRELGEAERHQGGNGVPSGLRCQHRLRRQNLPPVSEGFNQDGQGESISACR